MSELVVIAVAGFLASLVDGALGMGFGPTSATILLSSGMSPAATSATVNLAKVATGLAAGISHWRFDNIDRRLVLRLAIPGAVGALIGTTILANVDGDALRPFLAAMLLLVGLRIAVRFSRPLPESSFNGAGNDAPGPESGFDSRGVEIAGAAGGVTNGMIGAWGPVVTPFLLHRGLPPRFAVGSVNTAEVAVAVVSAGSLMGSAGGRGVELALVLAMLVGGALAAPLAAYVVRFLPPRLMGLAVAGLLLVTQSGELISAGWLPGVRWPTYIAIAAGITVAVIRPRAQRRRSLGTPQAANDRQRGRHASGSAISD